MANYRTREQIVKDVCPILKTVYDHSKAIGYYYGGFNVFRTAIKDTKILGKFRNELIRRGIIERISHGTYKWTATVEPNLSMVRSVYDTINPDKNTYEKRVKSAANARAARMEQLATHKNGGTAYLNNHKNGGVSIDIVTNSQNFDVKLERLKKEPELLNMSFVKADYYDTFNRWLEYKKAKKEMYKTQDSVESAYRNMKKLGGNDPVKCYAIVERSIANNWKGLFELPNYQTNVTDMKLGFEATERILNNKISELSEEIKDLKTSNFTRFRRWLSSLICRDC